MRKHNTGVLKSILLRVMILFCETYNER